MIILFGKCSFSTFTTTTDVISFHKMVHETINNITKKDDACKNMTKKIFFTVFSECYDSIFFLGSN